MVTLTPSSSYSSPSSPVFLNCLTLKTKAMILQDIQNYSPTSNTKLRPRRLKSLATLVWEHQILQHQRYQCGSV